MSDGILTQGNLFPLQSIDGHEIRSNFALDGTGLNGLFVSYNTGYATGLAGTFTQNPDLADGYPNPAVAPGTTYTNVFSSRYFNNRRVHASQFGDFPWQVAGVTLNTVAEYDENGNKLVLFPEWERLERGFVLTGQSVPVAVRGLISIKSGALSNPSNPPTAGTAAIISGAGQLYTLTALQASGAYNTLIVGRFTSALSSNNGGYAEFEVKL